MNGAKTYILIIVGMVYNVLASMNIVLPDAMSQTNIVVVVDFILALLALITNYIGRKKIALTGKTFNYGKK